MCMYMYILVYTNVYMHRTNVHGRLLFLFYTNVSSTQTSLRHKRLFCANVSSTQTSLHTNVSSTQTSLHTNVSSTQTSLHTNVSSTQTSLLQKRLSFFANGCRTKFFCSVSNWQRYVMEVCVYACM